MILLIDNYDSFTYNLAQLLQSLGATVSVYRNDAISVKRALALKPSHIVLSPGPSTPQTAGICAELVRASVVPTLGVCLGHQVLAVAFGGVVLRAPRPVHGFASAITHDRRGIFQGISPLFAAARYHSLVVDEGSLPDCFVVTARALDDPTGPVTNPRGVVMGISHRERPFVGVQFHPESVLTTEGPAIVRNFLR